MESAWTCSELTAASTCLSVPSSWDHGCTPSRAANFVFLVEIGFCRVAQAGRELLSSRDRPVLAPQSAGLTGVSHQPLLRDVFKHVSCSGPGWTSHSRAKAEAALTAAQKAQEEARIARITAKEFSPSFQHRENGLEYQRPKRQTSSDDIEVLSTGTPLQQESPELYRKGTTPSDLTPDDSPLQSFPASPAVTPPPAPAARNKVAHFSRQVSVDEERGGDIQMLLEGRAGDCTRSSWGEEQAAGSRGVRSSAVRGVDDLRARGLGRKQPGNPKPRERRTESPPVFAWTSHHRASNHSPGGARLLELQEEQLSNYRMEMKPLLRMEVQEAHPQKKRYSKGGACRGSGDDHRPEDRGFGVQRLRSKAQNKENFRPSSSAEPAVQKLASLRLGGGAEPRLLRWDLTFSPPQKSLPVALESDEENGDELKSSTVSRQPAGWSQGRQHPLH
ncbi:Junctophilin-3 [Plecturocebus cupreus]